MNCQEEEKKRGEERKKKKEKDVEKEAGRTNFKKGSLRLAMDTKTLG